MDAEQKPEEVQPDNFEKKHPEEAARVRGEIEGALRLFDRRGFIDPTPAELEELKRNLLGRSVRCPEEGDRIEFPIVSSENLTIQLQPLGPGWSSKPGGQMRIEVRRNADPEHIFLGFDQFPLKIADEQGRTIQPQRKEGHSVWFYNLEPGRSYTFVD